MTCISIGQSVHSALDLKSEDVLFDGCPEICCRVIFLVDCSPVYILLSFHLFRRAQGPFNKCDFQSIIRIFKQKQSFGPSPENFR